MGTLDQAVSLVVEALQRTEVGLQRLAALSARNALLQLADADLVLPSPAAGLMRFESPASCRPGVGLLLRSVEPLGAEGEMYLACLDDRVELHPWRLETTRWVVAATPRSRRAGGAGASQAVGIDIVLSRSATCLPGWLRMRIDAGPVVRWALARAKFTAEGMPLRVRHGDASMDRGLLGAPLGSTLPGRLHALNQDLLEIGLPAMLVDRTTLHIEIRFPQPSPVVAGEPRVDVNVLAVWNSVPCRYPDVTEIGQAVSEARHRDLHPLVPRCLGSSWQAWRVSRVGGARSRDLAFARRGPSRGEPDDVDGYDLAHVREHSNRPRFGTNPARPVLAVVLSRGARGRLDAAEEGLSIHYEATLGARANCLPESTEFEGVAHLAAADREDLRGYLVGTTWGGCDGYLEAEGGSADAEVLGALLHQVGSRTVADVEAVVRRFYGHLVDIVSSRDLLQWGAARSGAAVLRVRFVERGLAAGQRADILQSLEIFLSRYLRDQTPDGLRVLEVSAGDGLDP